MHFKLTKVGRKCDASNKKYYTNALSAGWTLQNISLRCINLKNKEVMEFKHVNLDPKYFVLNYLMAQILQFFHFSFVAALSLVSCSSIRSFCETFEPSSQFDNLKKHFWGPHDSNTLWASVHQHTSGWMRTPSKEFYCTHSRRWAAAGRSHCVSCSYTACLDLSKAGVAGPCDTAFAVTLGSLLFHCLSFVMHN